MQSKYALRLVAVSTFVIALTASTTAQQRMNAGEPRYDPKTEVTVSGTVEEVQTQTPTAPRGRGPMTGMMMGGTHLKLKTDKGIMDVRLGPSGYLAEKKFTVTKGDTLEVVGSLVKVEGGDALIARQIKRGKDKLELRDQSGKPLWSGYTNP
jgi:DNA/RNA endonuclease YhcR with UshA esterase domain